MRTSTIFKNRWMALIWAAGIMWFAYDFAGSQPRDGNTSANSQQPNEQSSGNLSADDQQKLAQELNSF